MYIFNTAFRLQIPICKQRQGSSCEQFKTLAPHFPKKTYITKDIIEGSWSASRGLNQRPPKFEVGGLSI
jgi:hypothetical protein